MKYSQHQGFDFILSTGVVHHLKSPALGLASLSQALAPHGGMFIMVYGKYGRTGVYPLQEMFNMAGMNLPEFLKGKPGATTVMRPPVDAEDANEVTDEPDVADEDASDNEE